MKEFNTEGTCFPEDHYMVDISERIAIIRKMVEHGEYFCINRGRQYGKTTTLEAIKRTLSDNYRVIQTSFEGLGDSSFASEKTLAYSFVYVITSKMKWDKNKDQKLYEYLDEIKQKFADNKAIELAELQEIISTMCVISQKPIVILIDEVDEAGNHDSFIKFLGLLRSKFLARESMPTFQSVIIAGVYDIKNLQLKNQYNSPWNIAAPFNVDMSLHADGIAGMLREYQSEHEISFDENLVAKEIYDYTSGYPFLVSRLCQIIDNEQYEWNKEGVVKAVHDILSEDNTLYDEFMYQVNQTPDLKDRLKRLLFDGSHFSYNPYVKPFDVFSMFGFVTDVNGAVRVSNRIFETRLYNYFIFKSWDEPICKEGCYDEKIFFSNGLLDVKHIIERFVVHYNDIYGPNGDKFKEEDGRKLFLLYLKPIINGVGNYYIEAETRDMTRTDIVVDYLGNQYVIELKIWRGNSYKERGEQQLAEYLDYFHLETGYLVSFCFNRNKEPEMKTVNVGRRTIYEAVV